MRSYAGAVARAMSTRCSMNASSGNARWAGRDGTALRGRWSTAVAGSRSRSQVIFYEEYARAGGPGKVGIVGEGLLGPTIMHSRLRRPEASASSRGSSPARRSGVRATPSPTRVPTSPTSPTRAELDGDEWVIEGQKVWTSLAHWAQWCFVLCRTDRDAPKHKGISYLLVPMDQPGIEIRPITQITGTSEFNEVFFERRAHRARERGRRRQRRLEGRDGHARVRARRVDVGPAARLRVRGERDRSRRRSGAASSTTR